MRTSPKHQNPATIRRLYDQPVKENDPFYLSRIQMLDNNACSDTGGQGTNVSFQTCKDQVFTLESSMAGAGFVAYDSPSAVSISSSRSPFSPHGSQSCLSDPRPSPDNTYGSPYSGSSVVDDSNKLKHKLRELELSLLGPESDTVDSCNGCFITGDHQAASMASFNCAQLVDLVPKFNLKQILVACGQALHDDDMLTVTGLMHVLEKMVSVSGEPIQRLGAYVLEGLRARLESSGSNIYRALKCKEPTSSELMSYMHILFRICPYWKFAYTSGNVVIKEVLEYEEKIHIIDFQIAQSTQWMFLIAALAKRPGGPPSIRITGIDDSQSNHARGGGLHIVGQRLSEFARSYNVPFEFHDAAMSGCEIQLEHLKVQPGEALAVNFPYVLHHMPDESVSIWNHRDRLLRLVKSLSPKVVTLTEQESNTNTSPFFSRYLEILDYYSAMFESIDVACPRDDKQRINAEQHCVARDIVNMIACEGPERVERHELHGKWRSRFMMAGFSQYPLSSSVTMAVREMLKEYDHSYRLEEREGALYLGWVNRAMATFSAWRRRQKRRRIKWVIRVINPKSPQKKKIFFTALLRFDFIWQKLKPILAWPPSLSRFFSSSYDQLHCPGIASRSELRKELERERRRVRDRQRRQSMSHEEREKHLARRRRNYQLRRQRAETARLYPAPPPVQFEDTSISTIQSPLSNSISNISPQFFVAALVDPNHGQERLMLDTRSSQSLEIPAHKLATLPGKVRLNHIKHLARAIQNPVCDGVGIGGMMKGNGTSNCLVSKGVRLNHIKRLVRAVHPIVQEAPSLSLQIIRTEG